MSKLDRFAKAVLDNDLAGFLRWGAMRYIVRWSNGFWKAFDTMSFADVSIRFLKADAEATVHRLNRTAAH